MLRFGTPLDSRGMQLRLATPGTRTRATSARGGSMVRQITPGRSPKLQRTSGAEH